VTAVVCIISRPSGEVALLVRAKDPGRGLLGLPGGFVDPGESADAAVVREVREEIGLEVTSLRYLGSFPNLYEYCGVEIPVTDLIFHCGAADLDSLQIDPDEIEAVEFRHPGADDLSRMAFDSNRRGLLLYLQGARRDAVPG
jgi:ADP-ribose pyrophosphatase